MTATKTPPYGEVVRDWYDATYGAMWEPWKKVFTSEKGCAGSEEGKGDCGCDPCSCCTPESDILVQARPGERRVVPMTLRNPGRRPITFSVDVGPFTPCGADTGVRVEAEVRPRQEFSLQPCEEVTFALVLEVGAGTVRQTIPPGETKDDSKRVPPEPVRQHHDACATLIADVRLDGCGSRPVRVAVTVLPLGCNSHEVRCDCGCC